MIKRFIKDAEPTKVAEHKVADYVGAPFYVGQEVTILHPYDLDKIIEGVAKANKEKIKERFKDYNQLVKDLKLKGTIIDIVEGNDEVDGILTINLGTIYPFTSSVEPFSIVFPEKKTFYVVNEKSCGYIKDEVKQSKEVAEFSTFITSSITTSYGSKIQNLQNLKNNLSSVERNIADYKRSLLNYIQDRQKKELLYSSTLDVLRDELEKPREVNEGNEDYYHSIFKNKNVKDINIVDYNGSKCLLLTTNELDYEDHVKHPAGATPIDIATNHPHFNIGGYHVIFFKDGGARAVNYTKFLGSGNSHPCVDSSGNICMGSAFQKALKTAIMANDYAGAIHMMIDFLKDPNSHSPYQDSVSFYMLQERKHKAKPLELLFKRSSDGETWDEKLYLKTIKEVQKDFDKGTMTGAEADGYSDDDDDEEEEHDEDDN